MSPSWDLHVSNVLADGDGHRVAHDWFPGRLPSNVILGRDVYIDTTYGFTTFASEQQPGLVLGDATGAYDRASFVVGPRGRVTVGAYTVLNGIYIVCQERVEIGSHALLAWGAVITDSWCAGDVPGAATIEARRAVLRAAAAHPDRQLPALDVPRPVTIGDNVWVGFDAVIMPGVTLGRGCVVASKCVVTEDVPPYAVIAGSPPRIVRMLEADDTPAARQAAFARYGRA